MSEPDDVIAYRLEDAGFTRPQVSALLQALRGEAASKADLHAQTIELRGEIEQVEQRLTVKIEEMKLEMRTEMAQLKADMKIWFIATAFAQLVAFSGIVFALLRFTQT